MTVTYEELKAVYDLPLLELILMAANVHHQFWPEGKIQLSRLCSIKTGKCSEDCAFCTQSGHYNTNVAITPFLPLEKIIDQAQEAKTMGATRFCLGAAWRRVPNKNAWEKIFEAINAVKSVGLKVCCTLGFLSEKEARDLKSAGCEIYNHNIESSRSFYPKIVTTHRWEERLETAKVAHQAGLKICCGGILGMGESVSDRLEWLLALASMDHKPEVVPINILIPMEGTPLQNTPSPTWDEIIRLIATTRIFLPQSTLHIPAGRSTMSEEMQALCFLVGANGIAIGQKLLTAKNCSPVDDHMLLRKLGLKPIT